MTFGCVLALFCDNNFVAYSGIAQLLEVGSWRTAMVWTAFSSAPGCDEPTKSCNVRRRYELAMFVISE